jgi:hypothetical protein
MLSLTMLIKTFILTKRDFDKTDKMSNNYTIGIIAYHGY